MGVLPAPAATAADALRPGDVIRLSIWREPELSGDFPVDERGFVVLPKIGPRHVGDTLPEELRAQLTETYERYVNHTSISVTVLRRVQVLGAVKNPGLYPADPTMTVSDVLALAGGVGPTGNASRVQLIRHGVRVTDDLAGPTLIGGSPIRSGDEIYVPERGFFARSPGVIATSLAAVATVAIAIIRRY
ncbi:MAG TPA: polysaccharide biosynthesis/export family protein [Gemmatimonadaceae bacterium]|nr:polysaccharide biosynthesis/export family protein [Gemmatimonadaceae bacterium]